VVAHDGPEEEGWSSYLVATQYDCYYTETRQHYGYCEPIRRLALAHLATDWVFIVDDDERPNEALLKDLHRLISTNINAYNVPMQQWLNGQLALNYYHRRLIRNWNELQSPLLLHVQMGGYLAPEADLDPAVYWMKHIQDGVGVEERKARYTQVCLDHAQRYGDIPGVPEHLLRCVADYPGATAAVRQALLEGRNGHRNS